MHLPFHPHLGIGLDTFRAGALGVSQNGKLKDGSWGQWGLCSRKVDKDFHFRVYGGCIGFLAIWGTRALR